jgi:hypothetical protein
MGWHPAMGHRQVLDDKLKELVEPTRDPLWKEVKGNNLEMHTDDACPYGAMGFGWVLYDGLMVAGGSGNVGTGIPYRAELAGLDNALLWLVSNLHKLKKRQHCLVTNCESAVAALKATKVKDAQVMKYRTS